MGRVYTTALEEFFTRFAISGSPGPASAGRPRSSVVIFVATPELERAGDERQRRGNGPGGKHPVHDLLHFQPAPSGWQAMPARPPRIEASYARTAANVPSPLDECPAPTMWVPSFGRTSAAGGERDILAQAPRASVQSRADRPGERGLGVLPRLGLGVLAALTPAEDEVIYTDDVVRPFDIERDVKDVDLVGISVDSKTARRSYDIAAAYRRRGIKVVLGGIHPTALPDEALQHADAVVLSEAEDLWPQLLSRFQARRARTHLSRRAAYAGRQAQSRGATCSPPKSTSRFRSCRPCAAVPTHASFAAFRPPTAPRCAFVRPTRCWPSCALSASSSCSPTTT